MLRFGIIGTNFITEWFVAASQATNGPDNPQTEAASRDAARERPRSRARR